MGVETKIYVKSKGGLVRVARRRDGRRRHGGGNLLQDWDGGIEGSDILIGSMTLAENCFDLANLPLCTQI